ncbi:MAG TPA: AraC family transcriptional regulator [Puia sp.]|nr:AraC family transcriptional regulator [Puia sp.]
MNKIHRIKSITEFHAFRQLPKPHHPLISVVNVEDIRHVPGEETGNLVLDYYNISLKRNFNGKFRYGQQEYDFDEGVMFFIAPGQVFRIEHDSTRPINQSGWMLLIHPDFLWNTPLAKSIRQREYFDYSVNEALFLSRKEEDIITGIIRTIQQEYHNNIDQFSQDIIISHLDTLLNYAERFYHRQFLTRKIANHRILDRLEKILEDCFTAEDLIRKGLPSVQEIAARLNVSPNYLSSLLKVLTGQSTQQHIHEKLIEKAKEKLSTTDASVSEIAYALGFEHPQSFSKFFKTKTNQSPLEFRHSFS